MSGKNNQFKRRMLTLGGIVLGLLISILFLNKAVAQKTETKARTVTLVDESSSVADADSFFFTMAAISSDNQANQESEIEFPVIKPEFSFNGFGFKWRLKDISRAESVKLFFQLDDQDWRPVYMMESASGQTADEDYFYSDPIFFRADKIKVKAVGDINNLINLQLIYFDSTKPTYSLLGNIKTLSRKITSRNKLNIISREEWGANESYRFWQPTYVQPKAFVIHHTAGSDGGDDPAATVRGIYYWHAVVLGWGDIGYNYLIDKEGNIYEGRYGGDKVVGAHTYNSYRNINYNEGTVGISILGCYEDEKSGCYQVSNYNKKIQKALTKLIATKAIDLGINLYGKRTLFDQSISAIVGHRRLDYTLCPGNIILNKLPKIRKLARKKYKNLIDQQKYKAKLVDHNFETAYLVNTKSDITVTYKNKGSLTLPANKTYLKIYNTVTHQSQKVYLQQDLAPGDIATFKFAWLANKVGKQDIIIKLYRKDSYIIGSKAIIKLRVDNPNQAKLKKHNLPIAILPHWHLPVKIKYKNKGITNWTRETTALYINNQKLASLKEDLVRPGEIGSFSFDLQDITGLKPGKNILIIKLKKDQQTIKNSRWLKVIRID